MRKYFFPSILAIFCLLFSLCGNASVTTTTYQAYFKTDSFTLSAEAQQELSDLIKPLAATGDIEIFIAGHTDAEGNSEYNLNLSKARATSVATAFMALGVPSENIQSNYFGETKPVANNSSETGKAKNRRVEVTIKHTVINSMSDILNTDASLSPQQFAIDVAEPQRVKGKKGIEILIPVEAFTDSTGNEIKTGSAIITLTEFTNNADAFFHNVTTMSDKGILESGGMFNISATAGGQPLQLKPGKELEVKIPAPAPNDNMKVYVSKTDAQGNVVWVETNNVFKPVVLPVDTRTIALTSSVYEDFISGRIKLPGVEDIPGVKSFSLKEPEKPQAPCLRLEQEHDLKNSRLAYTVRSKKKRLEMLNEMNNKIEARNDIRKDKYQQQLAEYLNDSATYPERLKAYHKAKADFVVDYGPSSKQKLEKLAQDYEVAVMNARMAHCIKELLNASKNGRLYNSDLVRKAQVYCTGELKLFRDFNFERAWLKAYANCDLDYPGRKCYFPEYFEKGFSSPDKIFSLVLNEPEIKQVLTALIDDNRYILAKEKQLQKDAVNQAYVIRDYDYSPTISYYAATVGQLGYVNCDRLHPNDNVVAMDVQQVSNKAESFAFIQGISASQHLWPGENRFKKNDDLKLLSVYFENGRPFVAHQEVKMNNPKKVDFQYKEMKAEEFKQLVLSFI